MKRTVTTMSIVVLAGLSIACGTGNGHSTSDSTGNDDKENEDGSAVESGTRDNPFEPGDTISLDEWEVTLDKTNPDATDEVLAENQFNSEELKDATAVMAEVTATYTGKDSGMAGVDLRLEFVGGDGNTYDALNASCGVIPEPFMDLGEQYTDAESTGNVCVALDDTDILDDATWKVTAGMDDTVFVAVK
ncbi:MAG: hypothetical protein ACRD0P_28580 [Stackebrandtia sp.]